MAWKIAEAYVQINAKLDHLKKQLDKANKITKKKLVKTESIVSKAAKRIGLALAAAFSIRYVGRFVRSLISAGSAVTEMENLFEITMGKFVKTTRIWSEEIATSFGRNAFFIRKNVGIFNVMLKSWGIGEERARDMAQALVRLTHDMSSFWDVEPEEMFFRMRSAMAGLPRVLRRFGVTIDEENVKLAAARMGINAYGTELTWAEKVQARFTLLMEQTVEAQGDVIRTSHEYANRVRAMQAATKESMAATGQAIIAAGALANAWGALTAEVKESTPAFAAIGSVLGWVIGLWIRAGFVIVSTINFFGDALSFWVDNAKVFVNWLDIIIGKSQEFSKSIPIIGRAFKGVDEVFGKPFGEKRVTEAEKRNRAVEKKRLKNYQAMIDRFGRLMDLGMDFWSPFIKGPKTVRRPPQVKPTPKDDKESPPAIRRGMIESTALPGGISAGTMIGGGDKPASETNQETMIGKLTGIEMNTRKGPWPNAPRPKFVSTKGPSLERQLAHSTDPAERLELQRQIAANIAQLVENTRVPEAARAR